MIQPAVYRALYLALQFGGHLVLANLLAPAGMGAFSLMGVNAALLLLLTGWGVDTIVLNNLVQQTWRWPFGYSVQALTALIQVLLFGLLAGASVWSRHKTLLAGLPAHDLWAEWLYFLGLVLTERSLVLYYSRNRAALYNRLLMGSGMVYLLWLLVLWWRGAALSPQQGIMLAGAQSLAQGLLLTGVLVSRKETRLVPVSFSRLRSVLFSGAVVVATNIVQMLAYRIDYWLLRTFRSDVELGIYAQANKVANLLWVVPNILAMLLIPRFQHLKRGEIAAAIRMGGVLNIGLAAGGSLLAWLVFSFWLLDSYAAGLQAFWLMLPGYFFWATMIYLGAYFSWRRQYRTNLYFSSLCLVLVLAADLLLIPRYGVAGAAIAYTVAYTLVCGCACWLFTRREGLPLYSLAGWRAADFSVLKKLRW